MVVIFGGNGLLGQQFCKACLEFGAIVYSCDITQPDSGLIQDLQKAYPEEFNSVQIDALNVEELNDLANKIITAGNKVDVLINSTTAKGSDFFLPFENSSLENWEIGLKGNLTIPFLTCRTFIPFMKKQKYGSIINISSIYGIVGNDQRIYEGSNLHEIYIKDSPDLKQIYSPAVYNAAKGGLNMFTRYLAAYYGIYNIRVNTVSPGGIYSENENTQFLEKYSSRTPLGRKANPDEMNGAVIFLASDASTYITGHNLLVDGGYSIW